MLKLVIDCEYIVPLSAELMKPLCSTEAEIKECELCIVGRKKSSFNLYCSSLKVPPPSRGHLECNFNFLFPFIFPLSLNMLCHISKDCCVHCILSCLFCEFVTLCSLVLGQASCGVCPVEACCCCCGEEMGDDCNCPCDMDCGIMDACCESSDCLEICMECCGICFPS